MAERPARVALLGGGVIGGGWAARYLLNGVDVALFDPDPAAADKLAGMLDNARRAYTRLTMAPLPPQGRLTVAGALAEAVDGATIIHESAPERVELKQRLLADADAAAEPQALICSSTSGLRPSELAAGMTRPERMLVAHPFNPVYLLPLVELCGGVRTDASALGRAAAALGAVGMHPLIVRTEIDGFIADRLLEALWREALWLVHDGVATVAEVDDAIRYGAGLRWAIMGTFLTYRIAGGPAGMRHFMSQFGPMLQAPWTKLTDVPELTPEFLHRLEAESDEQASGRSVAELERLRDDCLVAVLHGLRGQNEGAGATLAAWERGLMGARGPSAAGVDGAAAQAAVDGASADGAPADGADPRALIDEAQAGPLSLLTRVIPGDWIDYNQHVHESRYLQLFGDATDVLLGRLGLDVSALNAGSSFYTVETRLQHLRQLHAGDRVAVTTQIVGADDKRLLIHHVLHRVGEADPAAAAEQMLLHVDAGAGRAAAMSPDIAATVAALCDAHAGLPRPPARPDLAERLRAA